MTTIRKVALDEIWKMRQQVMYPAENLDFVRLDDDATGLHWGLYKNEDLVSVISVFHRGNEIQFRKFATLPAEQGKGYGTRLLQFVMDWAVENKKRSIWCNARTSATSLYRKFGMNLTSQRWHKYGIEFVKMEKQLKRTMQIIPAIDLIDGKCVRLTQGDYAQKKIYNEHPLDVARQFEDAGLERLHLVDLDGARQKAVKNWKVLEAIASKTKLVIDFGGGVSTERDVQIVFDSGASFATVGSIAVKDETEFIKWLLKFGADKFILGADVKDKLIAIHGWMETTDKSVFDFIENYIGRGVQQIFCTDVSRDGKLEGPSIGLYKEIIEKFPNLFFIASGGVANVDDLIQLQEIGCSGVIIGKAIYENRISLQDLKSFV